MADSPWIKMIRLKSLIPSYCLPGEDSTPVTLGGSFEVQWPNGTISKADITTVAASTRTNDGDVEHGQYSYFEVPFNGITIVYNLDDVELRLIEVAKYLAKPKKPARTAKQKDTEI